MTFIFSLFISAVVFASPTDDAFFQSLRTDNFQVTDFESCDLSGGSGDDRIVDATIDYKPNGLANYIQPPVCASETLEAALVNSPTMAAKEFAIESYFKSCGKNLEKFHNSNTVAMSMFMGAKYAYCNHPRVRRLNFKFDDGTKLGGVLAVQRADRRGIDQPRPLVIYKCGVFCEIEDASTKLMVMHMFDQAPFNVIAVGNNTSATFAADNNYLALGGYDDGLQLLRIAKIIRNSPISKYTTSIHVVGMSLGGHATLMSSYLNEHNVDAFNQPHYASALALCPVVDLKPSIEFLFADNARGRVSKQVLMRNIAKKKDKSPLLTEVYSKVDSLPRISQIPALIADYSSDYYSKQPRDWMLPPLDKHPITNPDTLWTQNDFFKYIHTSIATPTLVFSAAEDWVVTPEPNSVKLDRLLQAHPNTKLKATIVPDGNHCAFAPVYGWDTISRLYSGYVMAHSPELRARKHTVKHDFNAEKYFVGAMKLNPDDRYVRISVQLQAKSPNAKVRALIWGSDSVFDKLCISASIYNGNSNCLRNAEVSVPLSDLGLWTKVPETDAEAEQLTRWANMNLRYLTGDGDPIANAKQLPKVILWDEY